MPALRLTLRVRPGASRNAVGGAYDGPRGRALVVAVTARAVDGRATEAALRAVAEELGVRRREVRLVSGATSRDKLIEIDPAPPDLRARVDTLMGTDTAG